MIAAAAGTVSVGVRASGVMRAPAGLGSPRTGPQWHPMGAARRTPSDTRPPWTLGAATQQPRPAGSLRLTPGSLERRRGQGVGEALGPSRSPDGSCRHPGTVLTLLVMIGGAINTARTVDQLATLS